MRVLVAGAHGQVGRILTELLAEGDHEVRGMVRDESQVGDVEALGAEPVVADLTASVDHAVEGCDAIVFAAGSGGEDVWGVDRDGAINLIETAAEAGIERFVMLSSMNADSPEDSPEALRDYLQAKAEADDRLRRSDLAYTIVRPGQLTNEEATGRIELGDDLERDGSIPRADVARILSTALEIDATRGETFEVLSGDDPIGDALRALGT